MARKKRGLMPDDRARLAEALREIRRELRDVHERLELRSGKR
jgi:hypothetical protein